MSDVKNIAIIGGGPAGLMAADIMLSSPIAQHLRVTLYDQMPSVGRKLLMAGKSGLNCTHSEERSAFLSRYSGPTLAPLLSAVDAFHAGDVQALFNRYDIETFTGSSGRIFPSVMKASPFLRAWLRDLSAKGLQVKTRYKMTGLTDLTLTFDSPTGLETHQADAILLACGGGSWARLGSDGGWRPVLQQAAIDSSPFQPSNCGFLVKWPDAIRHDFAGHPVKNTVLTAGNHQVKGEFVLTKRGLEGSAIYALSRDLVAGAALTVDLLPQRLETELKAILSAPRGKMSLSNILRKKVKLDGVKAALLKARTPKDVMQNPAALARALKALPIPITGPTPLDEAISTAGGLPLAALDDNWMINKHPGLFAAGEMLDWDAPTGGYLLTACWATGKAAAQGLIKWIEPQL